MVKLMVLMVLMGVEQNTILERYSSGFGNEIKQDFKEGGILNGKNYSGGI